MLPSPPTARVALTERCDPLRCAVGTRNDPYCWWLFTIIHTMPAYTTYPVLAARSVHSHCQAHSLFRFHRCDRTYRSGTDYACVVNECTTTRRTIVHRGYIDPSILLKFYIKSKLGVLSPHRPPPQTNCLLAFLEAARYRPKPSFWRWPGHAVLEALQPNCRNHIFKKILV